MSEQLADIMAIANQTQLPITIISDACFSGIWVDQLKNSSPTVAVRIISACSATEVSYTGNLIPLLSGEDVEDEYSQQPRAWKSPTFPDTTALQIPADWYVQ